MCFPSVIGYNAVFISYFLYSFVLATMHDMQIDFSTLVDVRIVKDGIGGPREAETDGTNGGPTPTENAILLETPTSKDKQIQVYPAGMYS